MNEISGRVIYQERLNVKGDEYKGGVVVAAARILGEGEFQSCYVIQGYSWLPGDRTLKDIAGVSENRIEAAVIREAIQLFDDMKNRLIEQLANEAEGETK